MDVKVGGGIQAMARRPVLTNYPHLHNVLRNDPIANRDFNACLTEVGSPVGTAESSEALQTALDNQAKLIKEVGDLQSELSKMKRFINLLGGVIEPQVHLRPYEQDASIQTSYEIKFNHNQIRTALRLYWEAVAQRMETKLELGVPKEVEDEED